MEEVLFSFHQESSLYFIHINITDVKNSKTQRLLQKSGRGFVFLFNRNHYCISHTSTLLLSKIQRPNAFLQKSGRGFVSDRNVILSRWHIGEPLNGIYKKKLVFWTTGGVADHLLFQNKNIALKSLIAKSKLPFFFVDPAWHH